MGNMSYYSDLKDCQKILKKLFQGNLRNPLSLKERQAAQCLVKTYRAITLLIQEQSGMSEEDFFQHMDTTKGDPMVAKMIVGANNLIEESE